MHNFHRAASIGIIGRSHGPTAVFVTYKIPRTALIGGAVVLAAAVTAAVIFLCKE